MRFNPEILTFNFFDSNPLHSKLKFHFKHKHFDVSSFKFPFSDKMIDLNGKCQCMEIFGSIAGIKDGSSKSFIILFFFFLNLHDQSIL